jgi:hypothetical protein
MQHIPAGEAKPAPGAATGPASRNEQRIQNVKKEWDDLWDKRARELAAFAHTFGVGKEEFQAKAKELQEHPLTEALKDSLPGVGMARGLYQEGKRSLGEVDEADRALRTQGQPIGERLEAAAYHGAKATPIVGRLLDVAEDAYTKAGGQPVSVAEDFTDPKKYWKNINIAATSPEVRGTTEGAAVQLAQLLDGFNSLGKAYAARQAARPEILPPEPQYVNPKQSGLPPGGGPTTIEGRMSGEPPAARPGAHPEAENLTPKEQKVHNAIEGRVVHHAKAEAEVRRDLEEIAPEDRQAVLEEIGQRGLEAYRRGDMDAATEAVQHAHILKQIMAEEEAAVLEAAAAAPARPPAVVPPAPTPAAAAKPVSEAAPEVAKPAAKPAARPVATAEPETQMPLFYPPEPAAPLVPQGAAAEAPQTVGSLAKEIGETMTRQEMLDELGIRKGAGDPRGRAATSRLALLLAVNRLSASKPLAAAPAAAPPAPPAPQEAAPEATPEAAATAPKKKVAKKQTWADVAKDHYTPGNVVFNDYWNNYDKVLDFKPGEANGTGWAVQVIHSDKDGHPLPGEQPRWHSTYPDPKRDKVVIRAPEPAPAPEPEAAVTPKAAPAGAGAEPGVVGKAAERIGKRKREKPEPVAAGAPATTEPPPTTPAPPAVMPQEPTPPAPTVAAAPEAEVEHSAADKAWEATAPEGYVGADGETTMIAAHGAGKEFKTKAQAKQAIDKWKAGLIPADQYRAQAPEAPPAYPAAAPAPPATPAPAKPPEAAPEPAPKPAAAAPAAAPAAGPLNFKRVAGAATSTWQAEGTNYTVRLTGDGYDTYNGDKFLGNTKSLADAKARAQQDMAKAPETTSAPSPWEPPTPGKLGSTAETNRARREALAAAVPPTGPDAAAVKDKLTATGLHDPSTMRNISRAIKQGAITSPEQLDQVLHIASAIKAMDPKTTNAAAVIEASQYGGMPQLEAAAKSGTPEAAARAKQVLEETRKTPAESYLSMARASGGKIKIGADPKALAEVLGSSLYGKDPVSVVVKELLQNAWDSIRPDPKKKFKGGDAVTVHFDDSSDSITVSDNGVGMTRKELETVFTDLGRTGKLAQANAAGGFGIAKAAPFMMAKQLALSTVCEENGRFFRHSFVSTPDEIVGKGVDVESEEIPAYLEPKTGTTIDAYFGENANKWKAEDFARKSERSLRPPGNLKVTGVYRSGRGAVADVGKTPKASTTAPGAKLDLYVSPEMDTAKKWNSMSVEVNNNGIYQFEFDMYPPSEGMQVPKRVAVDVKATVKERDPDYPFQANREAFRNEDLKSKIEELIKKHVFEASANKHRKEISDAIRNLPAIQIGATDIPVFDSGQRMTPEEIKELQSDPAFIDLSHTIHRVTQQTIRKLSTAEGLHGDLKGMGDKIKKIGIVFSDKLHGVHITDPENPENTLLLINPFLHLQANPERAASTIWHTIKHEIIHDRVKGHSESFTSAEVAVAGALGSRSELAGIQELEDVYADPDNPGAIRPDLSRAIQLYEDSRTRGETSPDIFGGEGLHTGIHAGGEGGRGHDAGLRTGREETVSEHIQPLKAKKGAAPLKTVQAEAKEKDPHEDWLRAGVQRYAERRRSPVHEAPEGTRDERAKDIADAYAALKHEPDNPQVKASYDALKRDLDEQWDHAEELGVQFEPWSGTGQPYKDSAEMAADVRNNHHLFFFRGGDMPADHPLAEVDPATGYTYNEKLRAVHDLFGHAERGWKFGERGEENAWISHSQMFSREALPALTTETKGQNNWVNFGPHMRGPDGTLIKKGDEGWLPRPDRPFAEQKAGLLPKRYHYRIDAPLSFISPNTMDIPSVTEAQRQFKSDIHQQFIDQAYQLADDMGINVVIESALGSWLGGAENSIAVHYPFGIDPDLPKYFEATLGRLGHQFATARFTPDASGKDTAHFLWIDSNKTTTKELAQVLLSNGIENSTITPEEGGYGVTLIDANDALQENIKQAKKELGVKGGGHNRGTAAFPGDYSDREAAGRGFLETNEEIESRRPSLRGVRRDFESRPDYHLLYRAIREAQELVPEPDEGIGTLQSRQRTPEAGAIEDVSAEAKRRNPRGSTVPMMDELLLPNLKNVDIIGDHLERNTRQTLKQLYPGDTPAEHRAMVDRAVRIARDELKYQLAQENSGVNWYTKDIRVLMDEMQKLHPELADPAKERIFLLHVAATSPGKTAAFDNVNVAEQAYAIYKRDGRIPLRQDNGTPWGSYGTAPLETAQGLLRHFRGDEKKAMEWMLSKHSIEELQEVKKKSGFQPETVKNALPPDYDPKQVYGAYILGEKVGPFFLNLNGISTELTVDRWFMRTWNRLMGTLVNEKGKVADLPRGKHERAAMMSAIGKLEEEFGLETSQVQAALWYYEQALYSRLGKKGTFGGTYANAAKLVQDLRSQGHASIGAANAARRDNADLETTRGETGIYPERARGKNPKGEGAGSAGGLFGDTAFPFGELGDGPTPKELAIAELRKKIAAVDAKRQGKVIGLAEAKIKGKQIREKLAASRRK